MYRTITKFSSQMFNYTLNKSVTGEGVRLHGGVDPAHCTPSIINRTAFK